MKTILTTYVFLALLCPIFNYEESTEQVAEQATEQVSFWCDCGVSIHWRMIPLMKVN